MYVRRRFIVYVVMYVCIGEAGIGTPGASVDFGETLEAQDGYAAEASFGCGPLDAKVECKQSRCPPFKADCGAEANGAFDLEQYTEGFEPDGSKCGAGAKAVRKVCKNCGGVFS
jgi:hypothetical protein